MGKTAKKIKKLAIGAGLAYLGVGEVVYENVLNIRLNELIRKTGLFDDKEEGEIWDSFELKKEADAWYDAQTCADTVFFSNRLHRNTFAKVFFADEKTDKFAICVHGYSDTPKNMAHWIIKYLSMGFNVIAPYMVGHGPDNRHYCSMGYYDRYVVLDWIDYCFEINKDARIVIHGVSMGAATTMMATGEDLPSNVIAAVADCGYTSCWEEYYSQVGPMLHLSAVALPLLTAANTVSKLRGNFDFKEAAPIKAVVNSVTPTLFIHGSGDTFVPYEMMQPLYEACGAPDKEMLTVPDAIHAAAAFYDNDLYWNTVKKFLGKYNLV